MSETLNDKAVSTLATLVELERAMREINDYGEATGFNADHDQIVNDFHGALGSIRSRAFHLMQRIKRTEQGRQKGTT